jgi:DNA-binding transcriptional MerR regulator
MTDIGHSPPRRGLVPQAEKAKRHGVSSKTIDNWVRVGILSEPVRINGRKYHDADEQPRLDTAEALTNQEST